MKLSVLVLAGVVASPAIAHAGDGLRMVCSAVFTPKDDAGRLGLFIYFQEQRARDGESRDEYLNTIYQGHHFKGHHLSTGDADGAPVPIKLQFGKQVLFKGTYARHIMGDGPYSIDLAGRVNEDPSASKPSWRVIEVSMTCTDIST